MIRMTPSWGSIGWLAVGVILLAACREQEPPLEWVEAPRDVGGVSAVGYRLPDVPRGYDWYVDVRRFDEQLAEWEGPRWYVQFQLRFQFRNWATLNLRGLDGEEFYRDAFVVRGEHLNRYIDELADSIIIRGGSRVR